MSNSVTAGPLGSADNKAGGVDRGLLGYWGGATPLGAKGAPPAAKPVTPVPANTTPVELTIAQSCPQPAAWSGNPAVERAAAFNKPSTWSPTTPDFLAVGGAGTISNGTIAGFLGQIMAATGPISRLNFIGHGNDDNFPMASYLDPKFEVYFTASENMPVTSGTDTKVILDPLSKTWGPHGETPTALYAGKYKLDAIRAKFAPNAVIWLFLCHSGANPDLVQQIANTFGCTVKGFKNEINYCTPGNFPTSRKHRLEMQDLNDPLVASGAIASCSSTVPNFKDLDLSPMVVSKTPIK